MLYFWSIYQNMAKLYDIDILQFEIDLHFTFL